MAINGSDFVVNVGLQATNVEITNLIKQVQSGFDNTKIKVNFDVGNTSGSVKAAKKTISELQKDAAKLRFNGDYFKQQGSILKSMGLDNTQMQLARAQLGQLQLKYQDFVSALNSGDTNRIALEFQNLWGEFGKYNAATTNLREGVTALNRELQNSAHIDNAVTRLQNYFNKFEKGIRGNTNLMSEFQRIQAGITFGSYTGKTGWDKLTADIASFKRHCQEAGAEAQTLTQKLSNLFNQHFATAIVMAGIAALRRSMQLLYQNVVELDGAMLELRKVADETNSTYEKFFQNATVRAKTLGATLSDTINASADFARLGYNLSDAADLADAALVYKNVGDGISDISESSESIISTMKAFGIEASNSMSIVDKFNEVGKTDCQAA